MDREKALEVALGQIEKQFGRGAIMRMGEQAKQNIAVIPTGAIGLDVALGVGGLPRGRVIEIFGPESSGKCAVAGTYVWSDRGLETIEELFARVGQPATCTSRVTDVREHGVRLVNESGDLELMSAVTHNNRRPTWRVTLQSGRSVTVTANHPLRVLNDRAEIVWRAVAELRTGDVLVSGAFGADEANGHDGLTVDEAALLGYLVAEGTLGRTNKFVFTNHHDDDVLEEYLTLLETVLEISRERVRTYGPGDHCVHSKAARTRLYEEYGLDYTNAAGKTVPYRVRTSGAKPQRAFLSALFEGDGWIEAGPEIALTSASAVLAEQVQLLLLGLGVPCSLSAKWNTTYERDYWTVRVPPGAVQRFLDVVGFRSARRAEQVRRHLRPTKVGTNWEAVPFLASLVRDLRDAIGGDRAFDRLYSDLTRTDIRAGGPLDASRKRLKAIVAWADARYVPPATQPLLERLRFFAEAPYTYERITALEDAGMQPTFDVVVPTTHSFLANGIVSHNTSLALHAIAEAQKLGGIAAFIDAEHALDPVYASNLGVDVEALLVSQPDTGEQALEICDTLVRSGALDIIVIDSVAALTPRAEIEGEMGDTHVGLQARLMSQALRKLAGNLNRSRTCCIFINQLREKIGVMFGSPETTPGGRALKFYASVRLDVRRIESLKDGTDFVGNRVRVKVVKNKVASPFKQTEFDILFGKGISKEGSLLDLGVEHGIVKKSGAWFTYEGEQLGQGRENARSFLKEHEDTATEIYKKITELLGVVPSNVAGEEDAIPPLVE